MKKRRKRLKASTIHAMKKSKNKRRYSKRYLQIRNLVMARDRWTCQLCDKMGRKLQVHHINTWSQNIRLRYTKRNLISLCSACHQSIRNKEKLYKPVFMKRVSINTARYRKEKLTQEEYIAKLREQQKLPEDFTEYVYKTDEEVKREKHEEHYLRKMWRLIKFRTQNVKSNSYKNYGARGIKMHGPWVDDFEAFQTYIIENLGERPEDHSIDRKDNDKGYEPGNLRWGSTEEQGQNRRTTVLDEAVVMAVFILFHKYKFKQSQIMHAFGLNNPTIVRNVVKFKTWKNVTAPYSKIVKDDALLEEMKSYGNNS